MSSQIRVKRGAVALAFPLALFSYNTLAPWFEVLSSVPTVDSIVLRGGVLVFVVCVALLFGRSLSARTWLALVPFALFVAFYSLRLAENYFVRDLALTVPPQVSFGILLGSGVIPALALAMLVRDVDVDDFVAAHVLFAVIFLAGLALNWDALLAMLSGRNNATQLVRLNFIAMSMAALCYAALFLLLKRPGVKFVAPTWIFLVALISVAILTRSRGPLAAFIGALFVMFLAVRRQDKLELVGKLVAAVIATLALWWAVGLDAAQIATDRFPPVGTVGGLSSIDAGRAAIWGNAWQQFLEHPFFGDVAVERTTSFYPHNLLVESLISIGILGTIALVVHIVLALYCAWGLLRNSESGIVAQFLSVLFLAAFLQSLVSGAIWSSTVLWISSVCVLILYLERDSERRVGSSMF